MEDDSEDIPMPVSSTVKKRLILPKLSIGLMGADLIKGLLLLLLLLLSLLLLLFLVNELRMGEVLRVIVIPP